MKRLVIIGNGFDKAHSLPTGYGDFMNFIETSTKNQIDLSNSRQFDTKSFLQRNNFDGTLDKWLGIQRSIGSDGYLYRLKPLPNSNSIYFKSLIDNRKNLGFWSDLEEHYFRILFDHRANKEFIKIINNEFDHLKK